MSSVPSGSLKPVHQPQPQGQAAVISLLIGIGVQAKPAVRHPAGGGASDHAAKPPQQPFGRPQSPPTPPADPPSFPSQHRAGPTHPHAHAPQHSVTADPSRVSAFGDPHMPHRGHAPAQNGQSDQGRARPDSMQQPADDLLGHTARQHSGGEPGPGYSLRQADSENHMPPPSFDRDAELQALRQQVKQLVSSATAASLHPLHVPALESSLDAELLQQQAQVSVQGWRLLAPVCPCLGLLPVCCAVLCRTG